MKTIELKASLREQTGKRYAKALRKDSKVPGAIYNNGQATHVEVEYLDMQRTLFTEDTFLVKLDLEGNVREAIVREAQYHPVTDRIIHVEFLEVIADKAVTLTLPLTLTGTPVGVTKGGKLITKLRKIKVKGIPANLPQAISVDVSGLDLGGTIKVVDAKIEGVEVVTSPSSAIASVEIPRALRQAAKDAAKEGKK